MTSCSSIPYKTLSDLLIDTKDRGSRRKVFHEFIKQKFDLSDAMFKYHHKFVNQFIINHTWRWEKKSKFRKEYFDKHFGEWLKGTFVLPNVTMKETVQKDFAECSVRTQKRRAESLRQEKSREEIELAFFDNIRESDSTGAEIVKCISTASSEMKERVLEVLRGKLQPEVPYSPNEALALYVDLKCTRHKYDLMYSQARSRNSNLYPIYNKLLEAKKCCYPDGNIEITDRSVQIPLQNLLDHTVKRLVEACDKSIFENVDRHGLEMITKWGMDGASGQSLYKQIFVDDDGSSSDNSVFMISMVPLIIQSSGSKLWTNPHPSSTRLCRPISFEFQKEREETTVKKFENIESQIKELRPTVINVCHKRIRVRHKLSLTMLDGKSTGYLTSTATCNCPICGLTPKNLNNVEKVRSQETDKENYRFGLSSLHCWIRFLECVLHIAYKEPIHKWKAQTPEEKKLVDDRKDEIQKTFKNEKGLYLDIVKHGSGNSNDGNTARRFFRDPVYASKITRIDETLIRRFHVVLIAITSRKPVDPIKFETYATETINHYNSLYDWYYMPMTVHKVLFHGAQIMEFFDLPIGYYSEEAQEARNKDFKRIRECNTRKTSRNDTNEDIVHGLLVTSDPVIDQFRKISDRKPMNFDDEVTALFVI
ncbi:hypothetical protein HA402_005202 [Bradysia odoriphaga]|nr:hypothetical protein HA402_005202 [Bradysia odoriphaga]